MVKLSYGLFSLSMNNLKNHENSKINLIKRFFHGKLKLQEEISLLKWLRSDPSNLNVFQEAESALKSTLLQNPEPSVIEQWERLQARIAPKPSRFKKKRNPSNSFFISLGKYAAIFILGISLTTVFSRPKPDLSEQIQTIKQEQTISTPKGSRSNFILPDGSKVWLNAGSTLTFALNDPKNRSVALNGEAYFEVKKNELPFSVSTQYGKVSVKGTSFNVKAFSNDDFMTTVETGLVSVAATNYKKELQLKPGEQAYMEFGNPNWSKRTVNTKIYTSWRDGKLVFHKDPLQEIVKKLERWYNVDITVTPRTQLRNYRFTGTIEMESLTEVLELIRVTAPIQYSYDSKKRIVLIDTKEN